MPPPYADPKLVVPAAGTITGKFGEVGPDFPPDGHRGVDIANVEGTPVVACAAGPVKPVHNPSGSYGIAVCIDIPGTRWFALAAHLSRALVVPGDYVGQRQLIGYMGSTGKSSGPHVHWELSDSELFPADITRCADPLRYLIEAAEPPESHVGRTELRAVLARLAAIEALLGPEAVRADWLARQSQILVGYPRLEATVQSLADNVLSLMRAGPAVLDGEDRRKLVAALEELTAALKGGRDDPK